MNCRRLTITILLSLPLFSGQGLDRPSPMPRKARRSVSALSPNRQPMRSSVRPSVPERPNLPGRTTPESTPAPSETALESGQASYYASNMTGRLTASGEPFNNDELLGAHPSYPLGSMVKVTSLTNGKSVVVRIVDRGPYTPGRVINVSQSAARQLDMLRAGVVGVKLELLPSQAGPLP